MEAGKLNTMMKKIESMLSAASFAEEGEDETARSMLRMERRVLLALREGHIDAKTLKYALNTSKRIGAHLDILYVTSSENRAGKADPAVERFQAELETEGIPYRLVKKTGCLKQEIIDYTNKEHEILFAVVESPNSLRDECSAKDSQLAELWNKLKCPLVVVMDGARA